MCLNFRRVGFNRVVAVTHKALVQSLHSKNHPMAAHWCIHSIRKMPSWFLGSRRSWELTHQTKSLR